MFEWLEHLIRAIERSEPAVLLTVAEAKGSTPREPGAKLVVTPSTAYGSIGGGNLEYQAIRSGRRMLADGAAAPRMEKMPLGPSLGQCCGGHVAVTFQPLAGPDLEWLARAKNLLQGGAPVMSVSAIRGEANRRHIAPAGDTTELAQSLPALARAIERASRAPDSVWIAKDERGSGILWLVERWADARPKLMLFGAGHVGRALAGVLDGAPFHVTWVDPRRHEFPEQIPVNVTARITSELTDEVDRAPTGSLYLVMTHSHPLDLAICEAVLRRQDFTYLGLIGSQTKKERFLHRLRAGGIDEDQLARLTCPIGLPGLDGKHPREIAISVAAQLLQAVRS